MRLFTAQEIDPSAKYVGDMRVVEKLSALEE
jgi:hypothetical protein